MKLPERIALLGLAISILGVADACRGATTGLLISEFMARNDGGLRDADGDTPDWIEIYNGSTNTVNLGGWHLADTPTNLTRWTFPATNIPPGAFLVVFASYKDRPIAGAELHANFWLEPEGEYLALVRKINFGDVDGLVEINGKGLLLEWKSKEGDLPTGQRIAYEGLTREGSLSVICIVGDAETMECTCYRLFYRGKAQKRVEANLESVKARIRKWAEWADPEWHPPSVRTGTPS